MAHRKAGGTARNLRDSNPKYLGVKKFAGERVVSGNILVRQRGTVILPGRGVAMGKDHTLFANKKGVVAFSAKRRLGYDGRTKTHKVVSVN